MAAIQSEAGGADSLAPLGHRIGLFRLAATGAVAAAIIFVICWVGTFIPFSSPTHAYVALFTAAPMKSVDALLEGALWSALFGAFSGAVFAMVYNLFAGLDRR